MQAIPVRPGSGASLADHPVVPLAGGFLIPSSLAQIPRPANEPGRGSVSGESLLDGSAIDDLLERFAQDYPGGDQRAVASQWSKWLFHAWLSPIIAMMVLAGRSLPANASEWGVRFDVGGRAERLWLSSGDGSSAPVPAELLLERLVCGELGRAVSVFARHSGASVNVFWSNAGNLVEHVLSRLGDHPATEPVRLARIQAFLDRPRIEGVRNRLYRPVVYRIAAGETEPRRLRRVCCIRYRLECYDYCENCPLACRSAKAAREAD
ncbi:MAG: siderophore-iron reductase FhuF [Guyparkeria sp.]